MKKLHYGWIICGTCTLLIFVTMGIASNGLSVFMPYIMDNYGLTNAQTSFLVTLRCTFAFAAMLVVGRYYKLTGYRLGAGLAALFCCAAYLIYWLSDRYLQICIGASMAGISYGLGSMIPVSILINKWFMRHKALAIGICSAGSGLAVIVLPPVITGLILKYSLRDAFLFTACGIFAVALLVLLLIRKDPSDKGLKPLGMEEIVADEQAYNSMNTGSAGDSKKYRMAKRPRTITKKGWILTATACVIMGALANPGFVHQSVLYSSEGYSPMMVAMLISICGFVLTAGKLIFGEVADILGGYSATMIFFAILAAGNLMSGFAFTGSNLVAVTAVVLFGLGSPVCTVGIPVWAGDLGGYEHYADNVRRMQLIYAAGAMLFASVPGITADICGSYIPYYIMFAFMTAAAAVCIALVYKSRRFRR